MSRELVRAMRVPVVLTIAGSDPSGGAGIQADLKTFHQHRTHGTSVISVLTVQNTRSVDRVMPLEPDVVREQLRSVLEDLPVAAAKTGALGTARNVRAIATAAAKFPFPLVVDPVMISKHGAALMDAEARTALSELLIHATLVTPNLPEAEAMSGETIESVETARQVAQRLAQSGASVLLKGGHLSSGDETIDVLCHDGEVLELRARRIDTRHTHGTGCTYAAAITARLAYGHDVVMAVTGAHEWLHRAIATAPGLGGGSGPVNHFTKR